MTGIGLGILLTIAVALLILLSALAYADLTRDLPNVEVVPALLNPPDGLLLQPTRLYDRTGQHVLLSFSTEAQNVGAYTAEDNAPGLRRYIPLSDAAPQHLPKFLADATVVLADPGFWSHGGYRLAGLTDPDAHPTIAQKLVSDLLLYGEKPSLRRALRERMLAAQLTSAYGRSQVLEWYLNSADYGNYAYGADAAAELYFHKPAAELTVTESAVLAAVSQSPGLNPLDAPDLAVQRGRTAINLMEKFGSMSAADAQKALAAKLAFAGASSVPAFQLDAFTSLVLDQLDGTFTRERVVRGGLSITTTLDYDLQQAVSCAVGGASPCPSSGAAASDQPASALVLYPQTQQVLAAAASNVAFASPHDAGTLMSSFVYLTAFTRGFGPGSLVWDIPPADSNALVAAQYHGPVRMRIALANDYVGAGQSIAAQMGADAISRTESSFGLDSTQVSLLDMASAYAVFAANGVRYGLPGPTAVLRVEGLDHRLWLDLSNPQAQPVVTPALAYLMDSALSDESARWPSLGHPNDLEIGRPVGVKLGNSADGADKWAVGYTPSRLVAMWRGNPAAAAAPAAPPAADDQVELLSSLLRLSTASLPPDSWSAPDGVSSVVVCDPSGLLPTPDCPTTVSEVFLSGNEPTQADTLYRKYTVNRETGFLATVFTPPELVQDKVFMVVPPEAQQWAKLAGIPVAPTSYDAIQAPPVDPYVHISTPVIFSEVSGKVQFRGTATGADFSHYRLLVGQGLNPEAWVVVAHSATRIEDGLLGTWDTTGLSGLYAVELQVIRTDERIDTAVMQVTVKRP